MGSAASRAAKIDSDAAALGSSTPGLVSHPTPPSLQASGDNEGRVSPPRRRRRLLPPETPPARRPQTRSMSALSAQANSAQSDAVDCPICLEEVPPALAHSLLTCGHAFCQPCLHRFLGDRAAERAVPVTCPLPECRAQLQDAELRLFLTPAETAALAEAAAALALGPTAMYCPNAGCGVLMEGMASDDIAAGPAHCPHCTLALCAACRVPWHEGQSCLEYRRAAEGSTAEGRALEGLAAARGWQRCPVCGHLVEKLVGCNHVRCRCGADFCYRCGGGFAQGYCACFAPPGMREVLAAAAAVAAAARAAQAGEQLGGCSDEEMEAYDDEDDDEYDVLGV